MGAPLRVTRESDDRVLSPYCVAFTDARTGQATLINAETGAQFVVTRRMLMALLASGDCALEQVLPPALRLQGEVRARLCRDGLLVTDERVRDMADAARYPLQPNELAFHRQLNGGGYDPASLDRAHPPPTRKTPPTGASLSLPLVGDFGPPISLVDCLARRSSRRRFADRGVPIEALAALLQLACRVSAVEDTELGERSYRPYPSGGARYSLELYPVAYRVAGLEPDVYHYDPFSHALAAVPTHAGFPEALLERAEQGMGGRRGAPPNVLFVITSVFARTAWKYRRLSYHLVLSDLGALYQTLYLAAEQLGLGACALGTTAEAWTTQQLGLDGLAEAQVGCLALGAPEPVQETLLVDGFDIVSEPTLRSSADGPVVRLSLVHSGAFTVGLSDLEFEATHPRRVIAWLSCRTTRFEFREPARRQLLGLVEPSPEGPALRIGDRRFPLGGRRRWPSGCVAA